MPNPMESLQTLLRMKTPQQVQTNDPWLARRQSELATGADDYIPEADSPEFTQLQVDAGNNSFSRDARGNATGYGYVLPREGYRQNALANLKQLLGIKEMEQSHELQKSVLGSQAQMDRILAAQQAQTGRTAMQQEGQTARSDADRDAREAALTQRLTSMETNQAARDAAALERAQFNQGAMNQRADTKKPFNLIEWLGSLRGGKQTTPVAAAPAEVTGSMNAAEFDWDPATGKVIPRR